MGWNQENDLSTHSSQSVSYFFLSLETNSSHSFRYFTSRLRELQARMISAKDTPTLKWEFGTRHY